MINIIGVSLYGVMVIPKLGGTVPHVVVPGRLMMESAGDIRTYQGDGDDPLPDCLVSGMELSAEFQNDGLLITYAGNARFSLENVILGG